MDMQLLSAKDVVARLATLPSDRIKSTLRQAFAGLASGMSVQPPQTLMLFPGDAGDCILYPAALWDNELIGVKVSPYLANLAKAGKYPVTAYTMLMSGRTGEPLLVCDSLALTTVRTAATTSLALDYLIPSSAKTLAIIGAGKIALSHLKFISEQHAWDDIRIYAPSLAEGNTARAHARREQLAALNIAVTIAPSVRMAAGTADVVALCTSSGTPVIDTAWLKENAVVTSISTNVPRAHEIPPQDLDRYAVFCDYRHTAPFSAGEMVIAREQYHWDESRIVADLPDLVTGKHQGIAQVSGRAFFRSIGLGVEDVAIASLLV